MHRTEDRSAVPSRARAQLLGGLALAALAQGCAAPPVVLLGPAAESVATAIDARWREHIAAAQRRDLAAVMRLYGDDCVYTIEGQPPIVGKEAIERMEARGIDEGEVVAAAHAIEALRVDADLAHELGTVAGEVAPAGEAAQHVVFHFVALWRRDAAGEWRIAHLVGQVEAAAAQAPR